MKYIEVLLAILICRCTKCVVASPGDGLHTWGRFNKLSYPGDTAFLYDTFPVNFMWSVGTAAYQIEGAHNKDGKGLSIWDTFYRGGSRINKGDVGSDSYHNIPGDIRALQFLGVSHYRFSLSWPRIFPNGSVSSYNEKGANHYKRLIHSLKEIKVQPVVTIYHWDLPDNLQIRYGGWGNPILIDLFREYAEFCFKTYGDDVKYWITIDNPFVVAWQGYGTGKAAPGIKNESDLPYRVGHNLLKAHAAAWHTYDKHYRAKQGGKVSMALASHWVKPRRNRHENHRACQCSLDFVLGWFARPLFVDGDYPPCMKHKLFHTLPEFTEAEKLHIRGTADFFALSHGPSLSYQLKIEDSTSPSYQLSDSFLLFGQEEQLDLRMLMYWIHAEYDNPPIFVVESGWYEYNNIKTKDAKYINYLKRFIMDTLKSIRYDNVTVIGYTAWSLVDGFEWSREYTIRRGLFYVDFKTPDQRREPKASAMFYNKLIEKNGFPLLLEHQPVQGVFPCNFAWGVEANSIQIETTPTQFADPNVYIWNISGNGELRRLEGVQAPSVRPVRHCADYASIHQQVSDVRRLHVSHFHFALNWSSVTPTGRVDEANATLLGYYRCFVSELSRANVTPVVTLWHHTLGRSSIPAPLEGGGWQSKSTVAAFADYARLCYRWLGAHVKMWITLAEPNEVLGYEAGHHLLLAHALAWRVYDRDFRATHGGKVSLVLHMDWVEPAISFSRQDAEAIHRVLAFRVGWFAEPVFGGGDYPALMRSWLQYRNSLGLFNYQLPTFTEEERQLVRGTYDFLAISHYTTTTVLDNQVLLNNKYNNPTLEVQFSNDPTWVGAPNNCVVPFGLRKALKWIHAHYKDVPIYVMANGVKVDPSQFKDNLRVYYLYNYINEALKAYTLDGVNLQGYFAYGLNDLLDPGFGMYGYVQDEVIEKASLSHYRNIIDHNGFPAPELAPQQCKRPVEPCSGCHILAKHSVVGFLSLVGSALVITMGLTLYYATRKHS
ncbi:klotho [Alosa pseudoharengus]|uniref:klotho n=1 Tax=Alosa pseudoharengus TaxID=34774 RepID=UPI003F8B9FBA